MAKTCPNCGVAVKSDDVFCPFCGTTVTAEQASSSYSFEESEPADQFDSSAPSSEESYSYGSGGYYTEPSDSTRKWYQPPKRKRSAKHPIEWFFYMCWSLYLIFRVLFFILFCFAQIAGRRR